jgi:hypothetical protein
VQEGSTPATGTGREGGGTPLGVSSKGGTPFFEGNSFQGIGRASADSSTWVFIAGAWPLDLVHFGGVSWAIWVIGCIGRIGEKEGNFEIRIYFV